MTVAKVSSELIEKNAMAWVSICVGLWYINQQSKANAAAADYYTSQADSGGTVIQFESVPALPNFG